MYSSKKKLSIIKAMLLSTLFLLPATSVSAASGYYRKTNLVSDIQGTAPTVDTKLVNPWGLSHSPTGPWWIANAETGSSSVYTGTGQAVLPAISIPSPTGTANGGAPTGNVYNEVVSSKPDAFVVKKGTAKGPSSFIFATEDGTLAGWNYGVDSKNAIVAVDRSKAIGPRGEAGASYKGLATASLNGKQYLYATNFKFGTIEVFDENFTLVKSFTDPQMTHLCKAPDQCFAPFGIQNIHGNIYVTFALQDPEKHDDEPGVGNGFVDAFSAGGTFIRRIASQGSLNSPWGLAVTPSNFGKFSNRLLVGNFGDGTIDVYDLVTDSFQGKVADKSGKAIQVDGLWGLAFGNDASAGRKNELFFSAGIEDESHGVFGKITKGGY